MKKFSLLRRFREWRDQREAKKRAEAIQDYEFALKLIQSALIKQAAQIFEEPKHQPNGEIPK